MYQHIKSLYIISKKENLYSSNGLIFIWVGHHLALEFSPFNRGFTTLIFHGRQTSSSPTISKLLQLISNNRNSTLSPNFSLFKTFWTLPSVANTYIFSYMIKLLIDTHQLSRLFQNLCLQIIDIHNILQKKPTPWENIICVIGCHLCFSL